MSLPLFSGTVADVHKAHNAALCQILVGSTQLLSHDLTIARLEPQAGLRWALRLLEKSCDFAYHGASGAELRRHLTSFLLRRFGLSSEGFDKTPFRHLDFLLPRYHRPSEDFARGLVQLPLGCCCHLLTHEVFENLAALEPPVLEHARRSQRWKRLLPRVQVAAVAYQFGVLR